MRMALNLSMAGLFLVAFCSASARPAQSTQTQSAAFSLTIRTVDEVVQSGSPVVVEVTVKNNSDRLIAYPSWGPIYYMKFDVRDTEGNQPLTGRGTPSG